MSDDQFLTKTERQLLSEFSAYATLDGRTVWVHSSLVVEYIRRARELGCVVLGGDGARIVEGVVWPDLELIFDGDPLAAETEFSVEEELYFDVLLECAG